MGRREEDRKGRREQANKRTREDGQQEGEMIDYGLQITHDMTQHEHRGMQAALHCERYQVQYGARESWESWE
jgi:hypothetical protein